MNVRDIKNKARSVLANRNNIITVFMFISIITTLVTYLGEQLSNYIPFISLIVTLLLLPFSHGNVVTALKVCDEQGDDVKIEEEGLVGVKRYKDLFFTYFMKEALLVVIVVIIVLVLAVIAMKSVDASVFSQIATFASQVEVNGANVNIVANDPTLLNIIGSLGGIFFLGLILVVAVVVVYTLAFALTPFVLERYNLRGAKAMSESARLMKGHKSTLFMLYLSYIGWAILAGLIVMVFEMLIPVGIIVNLVSAVVGTYLFQAQLLTSIAVFFEEVDLEDKNLI